MKRPKQTNLTIVLLNRLLILGLVALDEHLHDIRHGVHVAALLRRRHQTRIQSDEVLDDLEGVLDGGDERLVEAAAHAVLGILAVDGGQRLPWERIREPTWHIATNVSSVTLFTTSRICLEAAASKGSPSPSAASADWLRR